MTRCMVKHTGASLAIHLNKVLNRLELTNGCLLRITTDTGSSNHSMTGGLQSTLDASSIVWPAMRNHIPCMAHVNLLALGAFMISLGVKGRTKYWKAHECDQQFAENDSADIGKSQRLQKKGNTKMNKLISKK